MLLVRSYRTVAPLPVRRNSSPSAVCISVALALGSPPPAVSRHPALWSPDFPPVGPCGTPPAIALFTFLCAVKLIITIKQGQINRNLFPLVQTQNRKGLVFTFDGSTGTWRFNRFSSSLQTYGTTQCSTWCPGSTSEIPKSMASCAV
jgi:hypothetical protein